MTAEAHPLWMALRDYRVGPPDAALSFEARLARENGWTAAHADAVMAEYRRFLFLAMTAGHMVVPSEAVDQAWHLHLAYTRDYWDRLCGDVLKAPLHHGPTAGGAEEDQRYFTFYAETLASYERLFGEIPPETIWPSAWQRFHVDPRARRVSLADAWVVPKRIVRLGAAAVAVIALAAVALWG
ncbi:hypothetical protein BWQ93_12850 [Sphingopyxis sp. QXT-31]|uniref:glycine-rich domain-containing protein n=1 Tax=Sphingopyxis sp. QXT-31 TaxID=1357916 RepID=UPI0009794D6B|nr:hypothetical protein [Sphingopyxis sp. QXT-31]APZ99275.1 hypothetical protein BWQ93_12850 [Sphingopyxis sp. QXT-31]